MSHSSADAAEAAYYHAYAEGNLEALMAVWWTDDSVECVHPFGPRVSGYKEVYGSWQELLQQSLGMQVRVIPVHRYEGEGLAVHTVVEEMSWFSEGERHNADIIATNIYRNIESGWLMVARHASPAPQHEMVATLPTVGLH